MSKELTCKNIVGQEIKNIYVDEWVNLASGMQWEIAILGVWYRNTYFELANGCWFKMKYENPHNDAPQLPLMDIRGEINLDDLLPLEKGQNCVGQKIKGIYVTASSNDILVLVDCGVMVISFISSDREDCPGFRDISTEEKFLEFATDSWFCNTETGIATATFRDFWTCEELKFPF
ncbi:MAG: hypothetical protein ACRC2T_11155 [Thermoguttaceae bacterium]